MLDPIENLNGPLTPPYLLALENKARFNTVFASQFVDRTVAQTLKNDGFEVFSYGKNFLLSGSLLNMEAWLRKLNLKNDQFSDQVVVNFSQCFLANAHIYYAQGPISEALSDMYPDMRSSHKLAYSILSSFLKKYDKQFILKLRKKSKYFIANSHFCASLYEKMKIPVDHVIYPPLNCDHFYPVSNAPENEYILTYFGKETKYSIVKDIAAKGVKIKAFGYKGYIPSSIKKLHNVEFLGRVSPDKLRDLYSNATFTLFTFNHEPFGYIPVESMACGTPVLTFNAQGPRESVLDDETGWLVDGEKEITSRAVELFKNGYSEKFFRRNCRSRALQFDTKIIAKEWVQVLKEVSSENLSSQFPNALYSLA
jgi:hypothetical protein